MEGSLEIHVKTNAPETRIIEKTDRFWRVAVQAKPLRGDANKELVKFLREKLNAKVKIIRGFKSKKKLIRFTTK